MSNTVAGLNRNFAAIIGTAVAFTAGAVVTTAMRVVSKQLTRTPYGAEDYTVFLSLAMYIVIEGLMMKAVTVGRRSQALNDPADTLHTKFVFIYSVFYFATIGLAIASILLLYRRIFIRRFIRYATSILLVITACWWIASTTVEIGFPGNLPATFEGNPQETTPFKVNYMTWWLSAGIIEQVIIIVATLIPMKEIARLQLSVQKKLALMLVFAMSYLCVGTGIARLAMLYRPQDPLLDISIGDVWVSTHLGAGIMSAHLPVCWPIISQRKRLLAVIFRTGHRRDLAPDSNMQIVSEEKVDSRSSSGSSAKPGARSELDRVMEAGTLGSVTRDGKVRDANMAEGMGMHIDRSGSGSESETTTQTGPASSRQSSSQLQSRETPNGSRDTILGPRRLELKPFSWRFSGMLT